MAQWSGLVGRTGQWSDPTGADRPGTPREVVRLDTAQSTTVAFAITEAMVAENLTVWVFERSERIGSGRNHRLLKAVGEWARRLDLAAAAGRRMAG